MDVKRITTTSITTTTTLAQTSCRLRYCEVVASLYVSLYVSVHTNLSLKCISSHKLQWIFLLTWSQWFLGSGPRGVREFWVHDSVWALGPLCEIIRSVSPPDLPYYKFWCTVLMFGHDHASIAIPLGCSGMFGRRSHMGPRAHFMKFPCSYPWNASPPTSFNGFPFNLGTMVLWSLVVGHRSVQKCWVHDPVRA